MRKCFMLLAAIFLVVGYYHIASDENTIGQKELPAYEYPQEGEMAEWSDLESSQDKPEPGEFEVDPEEQDVGYVEFELPEPVINDFNGDSIPDEMLEDPHMSIQANPP
jgi:hypothetical protein